MTVVRGLSLPARFCTCCRFVAGLTFRLARSSATEPVFVDKVKLKALPVVQGRFAERIRARLRPLNLPEVELDVLPQRVFATPRRQASSDQLRRLA